MACSAREQVLGAADAEPEHVERDPIRAAGQGERRLADLQRKLACGLAARVPVLMSQWCSGLERMAPTAGALSSPP